MRWGKLFSIIMLAGSLPLFVLGGLLLLPMDMWMNVPIVGEIAANSLQTSRIFQGLFGLGVVFYGAYTFFINLKPQDARNRLWISVSGVLVCGFGLWVCISSIVGR